MTEQRHISGFLGTGAQWKGDLTFEGRMRIDGTFQGRVFSEDLLEVGPSGLIEGQVDVHDAIIAGTVDGKLRVRGHLLVEATGFILGELTVNRMEVRPGGSVRARITRLKKEK